MSESGPGQLRFDDGKDAQALRTIGEVAKALSASTYFWAMK